MTAYWLFQLMLVFHCTYDTEGNAYMSATDGVKCWDSSTHLSALPCLMLPLALTLWLCSVCLHGDSDTRVVYPLLACGQRGLPEPAVSDYSGRPLRHYSSSDQSRSCSPCSVVCTPTRAGWKSDLDCGRFGDIAIIYVPLVAACSLTLFTLNCIWSPCNVELLNELRKVFMAVASWCSIAGCITIAFDETGTDTSGSIRWLVLFAGLVVVKLIFLPGFIIRFWINGRVQERKEYKKWWELMLEGTEKKFNQFEDGGRTLVLYDMSFHGVRKVCKHAFVLNAVAL